MRGLLADANFEGQLDRLLDVLRSPEWLAFWLDAGFEVETFAGLGLAPETKDRVVWDRCQAEGLILVTGNRNADGADSLENAIRDGGPESLPVFTVSNGRRVVEDGAYARAAALTMLEAVYDLIRRPETILGSGRVYLPKNQPTL